MEINENLVILPHHVICRGEKFLRVILHEKGFIIRDKRIPVMPHIVLFVTLSLKQKGIGEMIKNNIKPLLYAYLPSIPKEDTPHFGMGRNGTHSEEQEVKEL